MFRASWIALLLALGAACGGSKPTATAPDEATAPPPPRYQATIRWTSYGVPHIVAEDLGNLAFGQGYAYAKLHICILADQVVKLRSERARWFGRGEDDRHVDTDFGYLALDVRGKARAQLENASPETRALAEGFAAGYNQYLATTGVANLPEPCRGAAWVTPIDAVDVIARSIDVGWLASTVNFVPLIGRARPNVGESAAIPIERPAPASNGWAIGADKSTSGAGLLVANPHFPWEGALTFYESHLTIPGQLDAYGATIQGTPLLSFAFTRDLAWTHTFSASTRFAIYRVTLDPDDPRRYNYGNEVVAMKATRHQIQILGPDGKLTGEERELYRSQYGPMLDGGPLSWNVKKGQAFTLFDAAADVSKSADQYLAMLRATDLDGFKKAFADHQSTPFVNVIYADRHGNAFYADASRVPDMSQAGIAAWQVARKTVPAVDKAWTEQGLLTADGSMPLFAIDERNQVAPGAVPWSHAPKLTRRDFVFNANDSYWATNPAELLTGFSPFYGDAEAELSPRSRMNLLLLTETGDGSAAGADGTFTADELTAAMLSNQTLTGRLLKSPVVDRCRAAAARDPRLAPICAVVAGWNGTVDLDARGAVLWREFLAALERKGGIPWAVPFDPAKPIETPRGLAPAGSGASDPVIASLREAAELLKTAGVELAAPLSAVQFTEKGSTKIPMHCGHYLVGTTNYCRYRDTSLTLYPPIDRGTLLAPASSLTSRGYPINYGTSFFMVVELAADGPRARGITTYSASSDPASPHFADQTKLWAEKKLRPILFTDAEIEADPNLTVETVRMR